MTIALVFAATVTVVSFAMIGDILYTKNKEIASERLARGIKNSLVYMESVRNSCITLTDNETLPALLLSGDAPALVARLDYFTSYALTINGAVIYGTDGATYASSRVAGIPTLTDLMKDIGIQTFADSSDVDVWSFRRSNMIKIYNHTVYPPDYGILTYCRKIYYSEALIGYLFADILPETLYAQYLNFTDTGLFGEAHTLISGDYGYFIYRDNTDYSKYLAEGQTGKAAVSKDLAYLIVKDGFAENSAVTLVISLKQHYINLGLILLAFLLTDAALLTAAYLVSKKLAKNVTEKLDNLLEKMSSTARMPTVR